MRTAVASVLAVALVAAFVACADGAGDPSTDSNGTDPDGGAAPAATTTPADSGSPSSTSGFDAGVTSSTDSGTSDASDSGQSTDSGDPNTSMDMCPTSGATGLIYAGEYTNLDDPTTVPCPCTSSQCCYQPTIPGLPAACVKK